MPKFKNRGLIIVEPKEGYDYFGGIGITLTDRITNFNWTSDIPENERQSDTNFDSYSCVSFSANNCIETQLNWMLRTNNITDAGRDFLYSHGYIVDGLVNLSDRFLAIVSGTTAEGNSAVKVGDALRHFGAIPESMLPFSGSSQKEYLGATITQQMKDLGLEFLKHFVIQYQWLIASGHRPLSEDQRQYLLRSLNLSPWQRLADGHATEFYEGVNKQKWMEFDTYSPFRRSKTWEFDPPYVMQYLIDNRMGYTQDEIDNAKKEVLSVMKGRREPFFWRPKTGDPDAHGEAYIVESDGSFKYLPAIQCALFDEMIRQKILTPIDRSLWLKFLPAEKK